MRVRIILGMQVGELLEMMGPVNDVNPEEPT